MAFLEGLNQEDLLLLGLLCILLMNKKKENLELVIGLGFLLYAGWKARGILPGPFDRDVGEDWAKNAGFTE